MSLIYNNHPFNMSSQGLVGATPQQSFKDFFNGVLAQLAPPIASFTGTASPTYTGGATATPTTIFTTPSFVARGGQVLRVKAAGAVYLASSVSSVDQMAIFVNTVVGGTTYSQIFPIVPSILSNNIPFSFALEDMITSFNQSQPQFCNGIYGVPAIVVGDSAHAIGGQNKNPAYNSGTWGNVTMAVGVSALGTGSHLILDQIQIDLSARL